MGCLTDVARHQHAAAPRSFDVARRLFGVCVLLLVEVADEDVRALPRICDRHGPADAAVPSGDHGHPPGELVTTAIALLAVVGLGRHFGLSTRWLYLVLISLAHSALRSLKTQQARPPTNVPISRQIVR